MSTRSEFYTAQYDEEPYAVYAATSFGLCFAVFVGAILVAWRKTPDTLRRQASLPFDAPTEVHRD